MTNTGRIAASIDSDIVDGSFPARYALYFAPVHNVSWWTAGSHWLGRDAATDISCTQPSIDNVSTAALHQMTTDARRYGFHATLKAPFRLAKGFSEEHLVSMAQSFSDTQISFEVKDVGVHFLGAFLALQTPDPASKELISALAMRCVRYFDLLRAKPTAAELSKRRKVALSARQEALLARWGYQYTEEEYRFHMTLTDALASQNSETVAVIRDAAESCFSTHTNALTTPLMIDGLTIFKESSPGAAMTVWKHFLFLKSAPSHHTNSLDLPAEGRLFFVVGPSGVGKDALLQWVQTQMPDDTRSIFARRSITRPAHVSEAHETMTADEFLQAEKEDCFSMTWQANDTYYGIRRGIEADLKTGRDVIVNGSREYITQLRGLFPQAKVIWIIADPELIRKRIENRQRESGSALACRLLRSAAFTAKEDDDVTYIDNSGPIEIAGRQLADIFSSAR
ncbi:phosphonate metabolism protein/1,5-bisphosphokinase (PRPP-forming) PhnN [Glaciimonas sp. CA11.2]|uniref:phosphonate metabolism protein/1,5-bisphosphokinase (PRPP-forming) PhnN n=1 Tax=unclassified Glaciimonas TaxID=2644401 RepID=UPI002AB364FD|nr:MULTISPECIES: phosphonate metabolism protein/1,5-bisphosphokinase (PRPP-forming) PhnN [unclassified Glaciimonas]MDY7546320.1 phosphonate metabolism protein/1,5-bisphosphokinase (PRPP-forming) PhnN [Glaciimonas sp. CA11.2]MEB0010731.1 phosphonate metabolism protein/1,5-bisphosphokinase (PRPP-forming) PhnN [Glaciimonas sp. Cout2]MEB0082133.1 phosphonate metabolism protein/1,5-bisphosphokinase (PRPP-forming) PhnN [Glaciimonas sp. Gout2]MEB0161769.1 phosphonate metabolism protein/1,5-bisphosphok